MGGRARDVVGARQREGEKAAPETTVREGAKKELRPMQILAFSGSLRAASSNTALLRAAVALSPQGVEIALY